MADFPDIYSTFAGKSIFITGGSGFLGKVLLYKILKEFPDVKSVTLLMRGKKGKQPLERLESEVLASACFTGLKEQLGAAEWKRRTGKLRVAVGDVLHEQLGLSPEDRQELAATTNIILHLAATVNFQEKLTVSVQMNVLGTLRVLGLAKKCPNLEAMVHTSTCYVNYPRHKHQGLVREALYPLPFDPEQMCRHILGIPDSDISRQTKVLLDRYGFPNTYTFTKNMGEHLLQRHKGAVPVTIVRPSIVGCSLREPYPGWVDVLTAAGGIILTTGVGVVHELHCKPDMIADIVPVDYVVNTLLKVAYKTAVNHRLGKIAPGIDANSLQQQAAAQASKATAVAAPAVSAASAANGAVKSNAALARSALASQQQQPLNLDQLKISTYAESSSSAVRPFLGAGPAPGGGGNGGGGGGNKVAASTGAGGGALAPSNASTASTDDSGVNGMPFIFHSATSSAIYPLTWAITKEAVLGYFRKYPSPRQVDRPYVNMIPNRQLFEIVFFLFRKMPFAMMQQAARVPGLLSDKQRALVKKYARVIYRVEDMNFQFRPFTTVEWRYDYKHTGTKLEEGMSDKCRKAFGTDLYDINWMSYMQSYSFGLVRYFGRDVNSARPLPEAPGSSGDKFLQSML